VIIVDKDLMVLHIEDKLVNRGHGIFDTVRYYARGNNFY